MLQNTTDTQKIFLLCANFRGVTSTFTDMTPLDVTGMENILGRLSKVILLIWYLIIILLNKIYDFLDQHVTSSADMQHLASAADVVHTFEPDTAADTQQHLYSSDPLVASSDFNPATAADLQHLDISDRLPPAAIVLPISLNPVSHLEWEAGILLVLRNKFYLPFEALLYVSDAIHDSYHAGVQTIHVNISFSLLPEC